MLGPVLFILYTTPPTGIISSFDINHHLYADDTHIYMSLSVSNAKESLENLQHCVMAVSAWMSGSKLKLNPSKASARKTQDTNPSASAKSLGVVFDSSLNFQKHISQTSRACFYHIH